MIHTILPPEALLPLQEGEDPETALTPALQATGQILYNYFSSQIYWAVGRAVPDILQISQSRQDALAAQQLLPALCEALGEWTTESPPASALVSRTADVTSLLARLAGMARLWRRTTGVPAPIVAPVTG